MAQRDAAIFFGKETSRASVAASDDVLGICRAGVARRTRESHGRDGGNADDPSASSSGAVQVYRRGPFRVVVWAYVENRRGDT